MFERFTDRARKVMALANQEAQRLNHQYIGTEHILLGLVKEGSGVGANILLDLDVDLRSARHEVEKLVKPGPETVTMGKLPQNPHAKKVIEYAIEEARNLNHNYVGTEHLLLGLLREHRGVAAQVLRNMDLTVEEVREDLVSLVGAGKESGESRESIAGGGPALVRMKPSDAMGEDRPRILVDLESGIERLFKQKDEAIRSVNYELAAELRDQVERMRRKKDIMLRQWRAELRREGDGGTPVSMDVERTFLVTNDGWRHQGSVVLIRQGYLSSAPERVVRVRVAGPKAFLAVKNVAQVIASPEIQWEIAREDAELILSTLAERPLIEKLRHKIGHEGRLWEVDEFLGENAGLVVAIVGLESAEAALQVPPWVGAEVSDDPRYFNSNLVKNPFKSWPKG